MGSPVILPGRQAANGGPPDVQPVLFTCNACGHQMLLPGPLAPVAAQQHEPRCIGPAVRRILDLLSPPVVADA